MFASSDVNLGKQKLPTIQDHSNNPRYLPSYSRAGSSSSIATYTNGNAAPARPEYRRNGSDRERRYTPPLSYAPAPPPQTPPLTRGYTSDSNRNAASLSQHRRPSNASRPSYESETGFVPTLAPGAWETRASNQRSTREGIREARTTPEPSTAPVRLPPYVEGLERDRERERQPSSSVALVPTEVSKELVRTRQEPSGGDSTTVVTDTALVLRSRQRSSSSSGEIFSDESRPTEDTSPSSAESDKLQTYSFEGLLGKGSFPLREEPVIDAQDPPRPRSPPREYIPLSPPPAPLLMPMTLPDRNSTADVPSIKKAKKSRSKPERAPIDVKRIASIPEDAVASSTPVIVDDPSKHNAWPKYLRLPESPLPADQMFPSPAFPPLGLSQDDDLILYQPPLPNPPTTIPATPRLQPTVSMARSLVSSNSGGSAIRNSHLRRESSDDSGNLTVASSSMAQKPRSRQTSTSVPVPLEKPILESSHRRSPSPLKLSDSKSEPKATQGPTVQAPQALTLASVKAETPVVDQRAPSPAKLQDIQTSSTRRQRSSSPKPREVQGELGMREAPQTLTAKTLTGPSVTVEAQTGRPPSPVKVKEMRKLFNRGQNQKHVTKPKGAETEPKLVDRQQPETMTTATSSLMPVEVKSPVPMLSTQGSPSLPKLTEARSVSNPDQHRSSPPMREAPKEPESTPQPSLQQPQATNVQAPVVLPVEVEHQRAPSPVKLKELRKPVNRGQKQKSSAKLREVEKVGEPETVDVAKWQQPQTTDLQTSAVVLDLVKIPAGASSDQRSSSPPKLKGVHSLSAGLEKHNSQLPPDGSSLPSRSSDSNPEAPDIEPVRTLSNSPSIPKEVQKGLRSLQKKTSEQSITKSRASSSLPPTLDPPVPSQTQTAVTTSLKPRQVQTVSPDIPEAKSLLHKSRSRQTSMLIPPALVIPPAEALRENTASPPKLPDGPETARYSTIQQLDLIPPKEDSISYYDLASPPPRTFEFHPTPPVASATTPSEVLPATSRPTSSSDRRNSQRRRSRSSSASAGTAATVTPMLSPLAARPTSPPQADVASAPQETLVSDPPPVKAPAALGVASPTSFAPPRQTTQTIEPPARSPSPVTALAEALASASPAAPSPAAAAPVETPSERRQPIHPDYTHRWTPKRSNSGGIDTASVASGGETAVHESSVDPLLSPAASLRTSAVGATRFWTPKRSNSISVSPEPEINHPAPVKPPRAPVPSPTPVADTPAATSRVWSPRRSNSDGLTPVSMVLTPEPDSPSSSVVPAPAVIPPKTTASTSSAEIQSASRKTSGSAPALQPSPEPSHEPVETFDPWFIEMSDEIIRSLVDMPDEPAESVPAPAVTTSDKRPEPSRRQSQDRPASRFTSEDPKAHVSGSRGSMSVSRQANGQNEQPLWQRLAHQSKAKAVESAAKAAAVPVDVVSDGGMYEEEEGGDEGSVIGRAIETPPPFLESERFGLTSSPSVRQGRHLIQDPGLGTRHESSPTSIRERHVRRPSLQAERSFQEESPLLSLNVTNVEEGSSVPNVETSTPYRPTPSPTPPRDAVAEKPREEATFRDRHVGRYHLSTEQAAPRELIPPLRDDVSVGLTEPEGVRPRATPSPTPPTEPIVRQTVPQEVTSLISQRTERKSSVSGTKPPTTAIPLSLRRPSMEKVITTAEGPLISQPSPITTQSPPMRDPNASGSYKGPGPLHSILRSKLEITAQPPVPPEHVPSGDTAHGSSRQQQVPKEYDIGSPISTSKEAPLPITVESRSRNRVPPRDPLPPAAAPKPHGILRSSPPTLPKPASSQPKSSSSAPGGMRSQRSDPASSKAALAPAAAPTPPSLPPLPAPPAPAAAPVSIPPTTRRASDSSRPTPPTSSAQSAPDSQRRQRSATSASAPSLPRINKVAPPLPTPRAPSPVPPRPSSPASINSYVEVNATSAAAQPNKVKGGLFNFFKRTESAPKGLSRSSRSQAAQTPSPTASTDALDSPVIHRTISKPKPPAPPPVPVQQRNTPSPVPVLDQSSRYPDPVRTNPPKASSSVAGSAVPAPIPSAHRKAQPKEKGLMSTVNTRLFGGRRAPRMSSASMEAVLGAENNYPNSPASMALDAPPSPLPSRDPASAVLDWRSYEAETHRDRKRRPRPGVTWADLGSDVGSPTAK